jgi:hypothetical protein
MIKRFFQIWWEYRALSGFIRENAPCGSMLEPQPKHLSQRYMMYPRNQSTIGLAWSVLDRYFKGELVDKNEANKEVKAFLEGDTVKEIFEEFGPEHTKHNERNR